MTESVCSQRSPGYAWWMLLAAGARRNAGTSARSSRKEKRRVRRWGSHTCAESARICSNIASTFMGSMYHTGLTLAGPLTRRMLQRNAREVKLVLAVACAAIACSKNVQQPAPRATDQLPLGVRASVLQHHNDAQRSGVYVDASLTRAAAAARKSG